MNKAEFAQLIDAYAYAKSSNNEYLTRLVIVDLNRALDELFSEPLPEQIPTEEE